MYQHRPPTRAAFGTLENHLSSTSSDLSRSTLANLRAFFANRGHAPSPDMWSAIEDLTRALEAMAKGEAEKCLYLSSLDPGVGKTRTVTEFLNVLLADSRYEHVGTIICVGRLSEVEKLAREAGISADRLAVKTSDDAVNALGRCPANRAPVLITTQQMIEARTGGGSFEACREFHYRDAPRSIRVWDEAYLPGHPITLGRDDLAFLFKPLRVAYPRLADDIEDLFADLRGKEDGDVLDLPDYATKHGVELNDLLGLLEGYRDEDERGLREDQRVTVSALWFVSGRSVSIRRDGVYGATAIDYRDTLPADLAPLLILDASGRVRGTYDDMEAERGNLVRLKAAAKRYDPLTVHVWNAPGGKSGFARDGDRLTDGIARTIGTKPDQGWLVVCHRRDGRVGDVEARVRRKLPAGMAERVSFIPWGKHMATNDYADVPNVILAGTLFYRPSFYEGLKRLSAGRPAERGVVSQIEHLATVAGEHRHLLLQALCRGRVRKCDGGACRPMDAYVIASVQSGISGVIPAVFPGCRVVPWTPVPRDLKGRVKEAFEYVEARLENGDTFILFSDMTKALGMTPGNFQTSVRKHPGFVAAIAELGLEPWGGKKRFTGFKMAVESTATRT